MTRRRRQPLLPTGPIDRLKRAGTRWYSKRDAEVDSGGFLRRFWTNRRLRARRLFLVAGVGWMLYLLIAGEHGLLSIRALRAERDELHQRIDAVDTELEALHQRLEEQPGDPFFVERIAREQYGLARPGETVYRLESQPPEGDEAGLTP